MKPWSPKYYVLYMVGRLTLPPKCSTSKKMWNVVCQTNTINTWKFVCWQTIIIGPDVSHRFPMTRLMASALSKSCFNFISILIAAVTHRLLLLHLGSQVQHLNTAIIQLYLKFWRLRKDWNWAIIMQGSIQSWDTYYQMSRECCLPILPEGWKGRPVDLSLDQSVCSE